MNDSCPCTLCGCNETMRLQVGVRNGPNTEVRRCSGCGFVCLWPLPAEEELDTYYAELYRDDYAEPPVDERYRADLDEARVRVRRLLPLLRPETRVLEVGCGSGAFIDSARPYVAEVWGVEPDAASRDWIERRLGLSVRERVADVLSEAGSFDLVILLHVLEHVLDPVGFLQNLGKLLRGEARLVVEVPNVDDMLVAGYQVPAYLRFYYQKAHLYYFSEKTLSTALDKAGLEATIEHVQRYDLSNHIRWMLSGEPDGQGCYGDVLPPLVNEAYAGALVRAGRSDTLWAIARQTAS